MGSKIFSPSKICVGILIETHFSEDLSIVTCSREVDLPSTFVTGESSSTCQFLCTYTARITDVYSFSNKPTHQIRSKKPNSNSGVLSLPWQQLGF